MDTPEHRNFQQLATALRAYYAGLVGLDDTLDRIVPLLGSLRTPDPNELSVYEGLMQRYHQLTQDPASAAPADVVLQDSPPDPDRHRASRLLEDGLRQRLGTRPAD